MDEHDLYSGVIDAIRDPILVVDASGEVLLANPAALRMLERDGHGDAPLDGATILELVRRAERVPVEAAPLASDPAQWVDVEPLAGPERRWMMRIRAADAIEREFWSDEAVATVAHEIRNPVTAMINALSILGATPDLRADQKPTPARGAFERSARRLARLADGLLDLSRSRTGVLELRRSPVPVAEFVHRTVEDFRTLHPASGDRVVVETIDPSLETYIDADRAEQALWNLLSNAVRFTPRNESVTVRVSTAGVEAVEDHLRLAPWDIVGAPRMVRIDIVDTGLGMTPETMEHLFERHHASGDHGGAHLGLSITRALIAAHDGWMNVESNLGEGTTVSVFVPEQAASAALLAGVHLAARDASRRRAGHRPAAVALLERTGARSWSQISAGFQRAVRLEPHAPVSPRESALWSLNTDLAVALIPLFGASDPAATLGTPRAVLDDGSWVMDEFIVGWCGERDQMSFAQALHRAATRMVRARSDSADDGMTAEAVASQPGQPDGR
jgi:signal transduction histidine kinase